jgi:hypothetical protein
MLTETNLVEEAVGIVEDDEIVSEKSEGMKSSGESEETVDEKLRVIENETEEAVSYASNLVCHNCGTVFLYESSKYIYLENLQDFYFYT